MACVFLPVLAGVAVTNYVVDPGGIYSNQFVDKIIEGISKGLNVTNAPKNINDRYYKKKLCELYKGKTFDYLILGHSRVQTISNEMFDGTSFLNLWVTGGKLEDFVALYEVSKENNIKYKHVILCADPPSLFNANYGDTNWRELEDFYDRFMNRKKKMHLDFSRLENLFSFSYFQTTLKPQKRIEDLKFVPTTDNDDFTYRIDGSRSYDKSYRELSQAKIDRLAKTKMHVMFNDFTKLSEERMQIFDSLVQAIKKDGIEVMFFCCPYHPLFYKRVEKMKPMNDGIRYIEDYAKKNHILMIGHFNQSEDGFRNKDFYDQVHPHREYVEKLLKQYLGERADSI